MPIVQAYMCPRTKTLFLEKSTYVEYLKECARENLKGRRRERSIAEAMTKFDHMRKSVRSFEELGTWLQSNAALIRKFILDKGVHHSQEPSARPRISNVRFELIQHKEDCKASRAPLMGWENPAIPPSIARGYPGAKAKLLYDIRGSLNLYDFLTNAIGVHVGSGGGSSSAGYCSSVDMYAEDWPFLGAEFLYWARNDELDDRYLRIVKHAFPGIEVDSFCQLRSAGLLPEDEAEFIDMMFSFVEPRQDQLQVQLPYDVELPLALV